MNPYSKYKQGLLNDSQQQRSAIRSGAYTGTTSGLAPGFVQGNVVILPAAYADDFYKFCHQNPTPCPLISVSEAGDPSMPALGEDLDIRFDVPEYLVFRDGARAETLTDLESVWRDDLVTFVLGCSFSFEDALQSAGIPVRNVDSCTNVSMYRTNLPTQAVGPFSGELVVTMRPFTPQNAIRAIQITTRLPKAHGAPVHLGSPELIGIRDLSTPEFGDPVEIYEGEIPVYWGCGVTTQVALEGAKLPFAITHMPGKMIITELLNEELSVL
ncbi:MAG TPA: putative hydro-lyase [Marinobacterium sp.]|nr:putative hydro-lyase [Marinobacterium sp.]